METLPNETNWSEARLQAECFQWHWNEYPDERGLLFTVDNNANDEVKGNIRKAMGRVKGVSDMIYASPVGMTIFIEVKLPDGKQSPRQAEWERLVTMNNHQYFIVRSMAEFKELIQNRSYLPF